MTTKGSESTDAGRRAGFVALVGRPNVGKSTLLNAMVGERLSIVTERAQTTWWRVAGIRTTETVQTVFVDTPGVIDPGSLIHRAFLAEATRALEDADLALLVVDPSQPLGGEERTGLAQLVRRIGTPVIGVVNKVDLAPAEAVAAETDWIEGSFAAPVHRVSALRGEGIEELLETIGERLPPSPFLYPEDEIATAPVRFFVAELVRETIFERYRQEIPYSVFCSVEEFREEARRTYIQVNVHVERASQKGILVGKGGGAIRELGRAAREKIEHFLEKPVYLDLWVKVVPRWRKKRGQLRRLGLTLPDDV